MFGKKKKVNRIEIIGKHGRVFVRYLPDYQLGRVEFQDNGRTLKIFIEDYLDEQTDQILGITKTSSSISTSSKAASTISSTSNSF